MEKEILFPQSTSQYQERLKRRRHLIKSFKASEDAKRSTPEKLADWMTKNFGSVSFLTLNAVIFAAWILINSGFLPQVLAFDPFPFGLLTMALSIEAIILSIFVLISQNRAGKTADIREEIDLQVNTIAEEEITKVMALLTKVLEKQGVDVSKDAQLQEMLKPIDTEKIEERLEAEIT